jgi:hypothetical protein
VLVQAVRLLDVFVLGPFLWRVSRRRGLTELERKALELAALGTILFNGVRFLQEARD